MKALLVYANLSMEPLLPIGISSVATMLEDAGWKVRLFDTTLYKRESSGQSEREKTKQVEFVDWVSVGIEVKNTSMVDDYKKEINSFNPDVIGISIVENTYQIAREIIDSTPFEFPIIVGGIFALFGQDFLQDVFVYKGEIKSALDFNFTMLHSPKKGIDPKKRLDINQLPITRFNYFDDNRIYRPMSGKLYRMLPLEFSRGCPYKCSYCSAQAYEKEFPGWYRQKSIDKIEEEIKYYIKNYNIEYFYFISETFLAMPKKRKKTFYEMYKRYKIPFWFNTRPETIKEEDIKQLSKIGCHRISMGIEHGDPKFRKKMLNRNYRNSIAIKAAEIITDNGIELSINNMVGFPDETEKLANTTIELNRMIKADSHTLSIFQPFRGTELHKYCIEKEYWSNDRLCGENFYNPSLDMNCFPKEKIKEFYYNFNKWIK